METVNDFDRTGDLVGDGIGEIPADNDRLLLGRKFKWSYVSLVKSLKKMPGE